MRTPRRTRAAVWAWLGIAGCVHVAASPAVRVDLRTSWSEVPLLLEVIESISAEEPGTFFPLLDALATSDALPPLDTLSPEAIHQATLQTAVALGFLQEPGALASVELQIALHAAAPKVQAFYQFYRYADQRGGPSFSSEAGREAGEEKGKKGESSLDPNCVSWVDWYGERVCDVETLARLAGHDTIDADGEHIFNSTFVRPKLLSFDHIHPDPERTLTPPLRTAIFYASPSSPNFRVLHAYLYKLANAPEPHVEYVFRHVPLDGQATRRKNYLSGYGVALDLKKTDYLAVDDRHSASSDYAGDDAPSEGSYIEDDIVSYLIDQYPESVDADVSTPLSEEELISIGIQATQLITNSSNPLETLTQLSQNFPKYAASLARRVALNESIVEEVANNHMKAPAGVSAFWINGLMVHEGDITPFGLLRVLRKERAIVRSLTAAGLEPAQAVDLLTHKAIQVAQTEGGGVLDALFDASDRYEGGGAIVWWNDLTKDSRYARWNPSITGLLRQVYPGQMPSVKQNLINVVLITDLSQMASLNFIAGPLNNIISRGVPIRFGVVPGVETEDGRKMARLFYHLIDTYGRAKTMGFFAQIAQIQMPIHLLGPTVDWALVSRAFIELQRLNPRDTETESNLNIISIDAIINGGDEETKEDVGDEVDGGTEVSLADHVKRAHAYALRLDATPASCPTGHAFVNGKHYDLDDLFLKLLQTELSTQIQYLQEKVYLAELSDADLGSIDTYFYDLPEAYIHRNRYIFPSPAKPGVGSASGSGDLRVANLPEVFRKMGFAPASGAYLYTEGRPDSDEALLTTLVVADLDSESGIALMKEALLSLDIGNSSRVTFIHNPAPLDTASPAPHRRVSPIFSHLIMHGLLAQVSQKELAVVLNPEITLLDDSEGFGEQVTLSENSVVYQLLRDVGVVMDRLGESKVHTHYVGACGLAAREFGIAPGEIALVVNGRIVGPIEPYAFASRNFASLRSYEMRRRVEPVIKALTNLTITPDSFDKSAYIDLVSLASSVIASVQVPDPSEQGLFNNPPLQRQRTYSQISGNFTSFSFGDASTAAYHIGVLLDPVSEAAQKWTALLKWLSTVPSVYIQVYLNPGRYSEVPLKRFYRFNLSPSLSFDENGNEIDAQTVFDNLPIEPLYTLAMDVPPSWLVRPREALYDLDNIQLSMLAPEDRERGISAAFELDYLVIEGHARDALTNAPPRGLQMQLTSLDGVPVDDTQVVLNLGYLQFKATPGVFRLELREGRGRDVYALESAGNEGWHSENVSIAGDEITLTSFEGLTLYPRLRRRAGMEKADVLDEFVVGEQQQRSLLDNLASRVASYFRPKEAAVKTIAPRQADINIFTVASGLLYERFASIMILSVLKNTDSTVKFWFIENFLSPSFLEFLPHFAEAYNFDYELVTYKWPSWLRAQKEKQRIIWAYKILFLDVLFPMDLKKVIFVDADQIVRTDLKELVDLDLHGAPYGYTPMGDDNVDMEGFRFWKMGYWKEFLQGRPYHISALYVVDLARFRQIAAGDILRGHYQQLSHDPNSLANLDQDLPNNLQREVPIFSLPEDWLWCETWCSKDRLHRAKTIDLCQNPLTKEPKLVRARQIPEWEEYDAEIARFAHTLADTGKIQSLIAAADANSLASAGSGGLVGMSAKIASVDEGDGKTDDGTQYRSEPAAGPAEPADTEHALGGNGESAIIHSKDEL
ncbi:hypothetical protein EW145_g4303 [Phellinidium pouzarii]|uniref:Glycosyltransferase family 24 protein n=1 Tax=Phellinidium pouzarii TaxID=167371 RepID=A0A4S4L483_9AGAM|nr:hypothetical protein EW145_g4303 [Phellinidium pouzarii]